MDNRWSLRTHAGLREGLTLAQLEQLVRSGEAGGADEVSQGGRWTRVDAVPYLRRALRPAAPPLPPAPGGAALPAAALPLKPGPDGKLRPDEAAVAVLLSMSSERPRNLRLRRVGRVITVLAALLLAIEGFVLLRTLLAPPMR